MANFSCVGCIANVRYLDDSCILFLDEYKNGFTKKDGTKVDNKILQWKIIYPKYFKTYISNNFTLGMVVEVKGDAFPYAVENGGEVDGYSVKGQTINLFGIPKPAIKREARMLKHSMMHSTETPNLHDFQEKDF